MFLYFHLNSRSRFVSYCSLIRIRFYFGFLLYFGNCPVEVRKTKLILVLNLDLTPGGGILYKGGGGGGVGYPLQGFGTDCVCNNHWLKREIVKQIFTVASRIEEEVFILQMNAEKTLHNENKKPSTFLTSSFPFVVSLHFRFQSFSFLFSSKVKEKVSQSNILFQKQPIKKWWLRKSCIHLVAWVVEWPISSKNAAFYSIFPSCTSSSTKFGCR